MKKTEENKPFAIPDIYTSAYLKNLGFTCKPILTDRLVRFEFNITADLLKALEEFPKSPFYEYITCVKQLRSWIYMLKV